MLAFILLAAIDTQQLCAKYDATYKPPRDAVAAIRECGDLASPDSMCARELAEQFANGDGVERNYEVAEYLLCHAAVGMADAETEGMLEHLQKMKSGEETAELHYCDHVTSGYGSGYCANLEWEALMPKLESRLAKFPKSVRDAANAFVSAETKRIGEQSKGGTGYTAITLGAEMESKQNVVDALERWRSTRANATTSEEAKQADSELNAEYRAAQKEIAEDFPEWKTYLRNAQRAWIAYRDAFAAYYVARWHGAAADEVLRREIVTALTRERTTQLREE